MNSKYKRNCERVVHHLEYNAERSHLIIPNMDVICKLIEQAIAIEDVEERNKAAKHHSGNGSLNPIYVTFLIFNTNYGISSFV
jgi:hypothetical protein